MFEKWIQIEADGRLTLDEMASQVVLAGWDEADVLIRSRDGQESDLVVGQSEAGPIVSARVACEVRVPASVPVAIRQVRGNLSVRGLESELNAEQVRGNLHLDEVSKAVIAEVYGNATAKELSQLRVVGTVHGDARLKRVETADVQNVRGNLRGKSLGQLRVSRLGGNLQAKEIRGSLDVDQVGGNALLKGIGGPLTLDQVAGNVAAKDLVGGGKVTRIGGNLAWNGEIGTGCTYHFRVDGNALLRFADDASAYVTLRAKGKCRSSLELVEMEQDASSLSGTLGDGGAEIVVEAKGNILLGGGEPAVGAGFGEEISRQIEESLSAIDLEAIGRQASEEMEAAMSRLRVKLENVDWDRIGYQTQQTIGLAMERMQRDMDRMVEKAARHQVRVERRADRVARRHGRREQRQPSESPLADQPVEAMASEPGPGLDEERLSILRMVEQGQITPEEAEMLLDALA